MNYYRAKLGVLTGFGTGDDLTASKCWDEGWNFAKNGSNYDAVSSELVDYIWKHEKDNDKSKKPWPNPNPPDNYGGLSIYEGFDFDRKYAVPWFLFSEE
ncbi:MAG: hypothetical protein PHO37_17110 [Kiritimatiellae bacterium]|nr:hypothetical protein [Kiritimatiellia bacterium]